MVCATEGTAFHLEQSGGTSVAMPTTANRALTC